MSQITLTFPDGNTREAPSGITPAQVASEISTSLGKKAISATVNGAHFDLQWPIEGDATIAIHTLQVTGKHHPLHWYGIQLGGQPLHSVNKAKHSN